MLGEVDLQLVRLAGVERARRAADLDHPSVHRKIPSVRRAVQIRSPQILQNRDDRKKTISRIKNTEGESIGRGGGLGLGGAPLEVIGDPVVEAGGRADLPLDELLLQPAAGDLAQRLPTPRKKFSA